MLDKEQRIKEQRTSEAMRKGLMGLAGKLACIARNLGSKIVSETPDFYSESLLPDVWSLESGEYDFERVYDRDENDHSRDIGFIFDGLNRGIHLEIKYLNDEKSLTVFWQGVKVYKEVAGDLECYAPKPEWEEKISQLFTTAKKISDEKKKTDAVESKEIISRKYNNFVTQLLSRWGL